MFFRKKSQQSEENVAKKSIKHVDTVVTGLILGGIIASIYGIKKSKEHTSSHDHEDHSSHEAPKTEQEAVNDTPKKVGEK